MNQAIVHDLNCCPSFSQHRWSHTGQSSRGRHTAGDGSCLRSESDRNDSADPGCPPEHEAEDGWKDHHILKFYREDG